MRRVVMWSALVAVVLGVSLAWAGHQGLYSTQTNQVIRVLDHAETYASPEQIAQAEARVQQVLADGQARLDEIDREIQRKREQYEASAWGQTVQWLKRAGWVAATIVFLLLYKVWFWLLGIFTVRDTQIGEVTIKWRILTAKKRLPDGKIIALEGEAGIQADTLAPGLHWFYWPWQYHVKRYDFTTIPEGKVGVIEANDGTPLVGRVLGRAVDCDVFQSARRFLEGGGERGPQIAVLPPGTYRINKGLFGVSLSDAVTISDKEVGVVTTQDGQPLPAGEIAAPPVEGHRSFQDGQAFMDNLGYKGVQEQVLLAGRYFINPRFAQVKKERLTEVPIAHVGVVIAYVGEDGGDASGADFEQGKLVQKGHKGVWIDVLDPGMYPINPITHKVQAVPTDNVIFNWASSTEAQLHDNELSTITARSKDGFAFNLDVSQIINISRKHAPYVIARFGSMENLKLQVLEPLVGNYFRNSAQQYDVIDFLGSRQERQESAKATIRATLNEYNINGVDTLIGDIHPPEELMKTLKDRKVADQERLTFTVQQKSEEQRIALEEQRALADTKASVVTAARAVEIAEQNAKAAIATAEGDAKSKTINAEADRDVLVKNGEGRAKATSDVGLAEASVLKEKTMAIGQTNFAIMEVMQDLAESKVKLVPDIIASGSGENGGSAHHSMLTAFLAVMMDRMAKDHATAVTAPVATFPATSTKEKP